MPRRTSYMADVAAKAISDVISKKQSFRTHGLSHRQYEDDLVTSILAMERDDQLVNRSQILDKAPAIPLPLSSNRLLRAKGLAWFVEHRIS
ncbi:hypothetical protein H257_11981 [Aphanomyces astaci]|uniref:Uncharacterized protein n=1 Tax=Aphanomyces astaci TaxID=112090 RepID=W4G0F7_APHAT|nr:hypothetical protein H257_11981 [Aphanomyces astaci]ETV73165.1 hypothetical protein H257_11981 [Aphanomyces astaci]|eukprot:XP_009837370.1 hypothetical protein H257_11981 [Aphanomyces astaci]